MVQVARTSCAPVSLLFHDCLCHAAWLFHLFYHGKRPSIAKQRESSLAFLSFVEATLGNSSGSQAIGSTGDPGHTAAKMRSIRAVKKTHWTELTAELVREVDH